MKRILIFFLLSIPLIPLLRAEEAVSAAPPRQRPKVGLVLSGGGAKGMSHIGALKVIEELGIPIDYVVGTSIGSIIGGFYALGYQAGELDSLVRAQDWDLLMKDPVGRRSVAYSYKEDNDRFILSIPFKKHEKLPKESADATKGQQDLLRNMPGALVEGQNLDQLFTKLSVGYQNDIDFDTLPIPFACVAVDLNTKEEVVFRSGDIVTAIRSSMSIPGYFAPVRIGDQYLIDGGMLNNLPVDVVRQMGADYVITIDLHRFKKSRPDTEQTIPEMIATMLSMMNGEKYQSGRNASDILIEPNTSAYGVLAFDERSVSALIDSGAVAAARVLPQLRSLADHLQTYPDTQRQRPPHAIDLNRTPIRISHIQIHGGGPKEMEWILAKIGIAPGQWVTGSDMDRAMDFIYNTRCFTKASYDVVGTEEEGYSLNINLEPQRIHEASIGFRFDSEEMASILLGLSLNKRKLFGHKFDFETELGAHANARIGYGYTFHNLTRLNVSAAWRQMTVDFYNPFPSQKKKAYSYLLNYSDRYQVFSAETDYQITGWRNADIRFGARYDYYLCQTIYAGDTPAQVASPVPAQAWKGFVNWKFDSMDNSYFPTRGLKIDLHAAVHNSPESWFEEGRIDIKAALPLGNRVTLIPQTYNRWMFGSLPRYYRNNIGGLMQGRYAPWHLPFAGINHAHSAQDRVDIVRADLSVNLFRQHYLILTGNYLYEWDEDYYADNVGFAAGYAVNTLIGPVRFVAHWSTLSRRPGFHFSLGCDF